MDSEGVSRGRSVDVPVGCLHLNDTSTTFLLQFHGTSMAQKEKIKRIGDSFLNSQEIQCHLNAPFFGYSS